jgi:hypothetical protein
MRDDDASTQLAGYLDVSASQPEFEPLATRWTADTPVTTLPWVCVAAIDVIKNVFRLGNDDSNGCTKFSLAT